MSYTDQKLTITVVPTLTGELTMKQTEDGYVFHAGKKGGRISFDLTKQEGLLPFHKEQYFVFPISYDSYHSYYYGLFFKNSNQDFVKADFATLPFMDVEVSFPLTFLNLETVFMKRTPGRLKNMMHGTPLLPEEVTTLELYIPESSSECDIICRYPYLNPTEPKNNKSVTPQVDELGQWKKKEWPAKIKDRKALNEYLQEEYNRPYESALKDVSPYGGSLSMKREATGFFRIHEENGVYWFCDPLGYLMFSDGVDIVAPGDYTVTKDLEQLWDVLPPKDGIYKDAWRHEMASFDIFNLIEAFGDDYQDKWKELTAKRLKSWGFHSIGNWSTPGFASAAKMSYVMQGDFPTTEHTIFRSMPDVFSKEYRDNAISCAQYLENVKDDPYLIGYFMRNEPDWAFGNYNMAGMMLEKDIDFVSKDVFVGDMVKKYGTIENLNQAWNQSFTSFEQLKRPMERPWTFSKEAEADLWDFTRRLIREYVRVPAEAYKRVDPNHLNLGLRYGWLATDDLVIGCEYCDVFSLNCYQEAPDRALFERIHAMTRKPILIGEFQVGSLDVGLMSNGMYGVSSQKERGTFYQYYMEQAASMPYLLGAHYFQYLDQPVLGRFDGENLNIGLVDVCNQPYEEFVKGVTQTNLRLTDIHAGTIKPTTVRSNLVAKEGF